MPLSIASVTSSKASIEALRISEPPWAMPVSMMRSGFTAQTTSWKLTMSAGSWMIGRPIQAKLYMYFLSKALIIHSRERSSQAFSPG